MTTVQRRWLIVTDLPAEALQVLETALQEQKIARAEKMRWADWLRGTPVDGITHVALDSTQSPTPQVIQTILRYRQRGVQVVPLPLLYELTLRQIWLEKFSLKQLKPLGHIWEVYARGRDVFFALLGLGVLGGVLPFVASAIWLESGSPILYSQIRTGKNGGIFRLFKFRTMHQEAEQDGQVRWADLNDPRVTRVGRFLRRTRLDELPQFWNVLKGEMSLIGPRPERPEFITILERDIPFYRARVLVKPGLTGWAQINYKYGATIHEAAIKLQYDLYYLKYRSIWLDLLIIWRTLQVVVQMTGT